MNSDLIQQFITVVPICSLTSPVHSVLPMVKPEAEGKILVVDLDQSPIGVVSVYDLLLGLAITQDMTTPLDLLYQSQLAAVCAVLPQAYPIGQGNPSSGLEARRTEPILRPSLQDCLDALVDQGQRWSPSQQGSLSPLRSIRCIPDSYSIRDFQLNVMAELQPQITAQPSFMASSLPNADVEWVVVNSQGAGLGLLDQPRVWQYLALTTTMEGRYLPLPIGPTAGQGVRGQPLQPHGSWYEHTNDLWNVFVRRLEEEQMQIQQLAHKVSQYQLRLKQKDDLLAHLSHEMKTPITAVMGLAELLIVAPPEYQSERHQHYAQLIYQSSRRLMKLMANSLDLIHAETQQLTVTRHPVAIAPICEAAYQQAQEEYVLFTDTAQEAAEDRSYFTPTPSASTTARTDSCQKLDQRYPLMVTVYPRAETVMADERCLKRLLTNLFMTALQLIPCNEGDGRTPIMVTVSTKNGWTAIQLTYPSKALTVDDQGRIFQQLDPLERVESAAFGQLGFRLMLALRLAEQHGGTLTFLNRPSPLDAEGHPSQMEMTLFLPAELSTQSTLSAQSPQATETAESGDNRNAKSASPSMLPRSGVAVVVDDAPSRIVAAADALSTIGYWGAIARSGQEALSKIQQLHPQIILLNPTITYLPNQELLTVLRQNKQTQLIPIIAIAPPPKTAPDLMRIDGHIHFPFEPTLLQQMIVALTQPTISDAVAPFSPPITLLYCNPVAWDNPDWRESPDNLPLSSQLPTDDSERHNLEAQTSPVSQSPLADPLDSIDLNAILHPYHCRVIEVDGIDQAELLARVWQPNLIVCGGRADSIDQTQPPALDQFLRAFQQCEELARLPLVTLTAKSTELAHQLGLRVFPCLTPLLAVPNPDGSTTSLALIQVIQVAIGSQAV
ncbi:MAG: histidine kinase dimerization/phospho-acceptor domain-containing protein [Leptolyngbyaceae bacterium]|nr:histidine kinase dimerization/phospho-acceptor domain-containing protein [Leptolyngbyaceae bacterium]